MRDIEKGLFAKQFSKTCLSCGDWPLTCHPDTPMRATFPRNLKAVLKNHLAYCRSGASLHGQGTRPREVAPLRPNKTSSPSVFIGDLLLALFICGGDSRLRPSGMTKKNVIPEICNPGYKCA